MRGTLLTLAEMASRPGSGGPDSRPEPVGIGPGQNWDELARARDAWRDALIASGRRRAALHFENTFEFAGALLGTWAAGLTAVLAGDATEFTTSDLQGRADLFLGGFPERVNPWRAPPPAATSPAIARPFPALPLVIFTSGSTGRPVAIEKSRQDIDNEIASLENVLGGSGLRRVLSTVGHQHIYGLLFRCLWPLAAGRPFSDSVIRFPDELEAAVRPGSALVASPAFLKRLPEEGGSIGPLAAVFSSGGSLPWAAAMACRKILGAVPVEIYGSSETGGIGWRRRTEEAGAWTLFPGVKAGIGEDGNLVLLASPHAATPVATADRVMLVENGLVLLGRSDRIVKLEEKRLSLTAMETLLLAHPRVAEARLLLLTEERVALAAVIRLKDAIPPRGSEARAALVQSLRAHLLQGFERVLLPKRWRFVETLPVNATGKTVQSDLEALFEPQWGPVIVAAQGPENGTAVLELDMVPELDYFQGHFPEVPLLPGVVQIHWAIREGTRLFGPFGPFRSLHAVKFLRPIQPGMRINLRLTSLPGKAGLAFQYESSQGRHSGGEARFLPCSAPAP